MEVQDLETGSQREPEAQYTEPDVDALYQRSLLHFQEGRWEEAQAGFEEVLRLRPDAVDARVFLDQTRVKASLEQDKPRPKRILLQGRVRTLALILAALGAIVILIAGVRWAYGRWVTPAQTLQEEETRRAQELEQAHAYLAKADYAAAEEAFRAVLAEDPDNQEAQEGLAEVQRRSDLAETYAKAQQAISDEDWDEALRLLATILSQDPGYRDVQAKQTFVQEQQRVSALFEEAEATYGAGNWAEAIASYESLRNMDMQYERQTVTERLFDSYLQRGIHLIESTQGESEAVREAQALYQKALALRPQEPQVTQEKAMAEKYLEAQSLLAEGDSQGAITALRWIYEQEPAYAAGNVAALLKATGAGEAVETPPVIGSEDSFQAQYARAMQSGDAALVAGDHAQAEQHYRQATMIAIHGGYDSARWLFASYAKLGTAQARTGNYDRAVEAIKTSLQVMSKSAVAMPPESYTGFIEQGDRHAQNGDYPNAFAQYQEALRVMGRKCNCGLENWSILP